MCDVQTDREWVVRSGVKEGVKTHTHTRGHARTNGSHIRKLRLSCPRHKVTFAPKSIKYFYTRDSHPHPVRYLLQMPELRKYLHVNGPQRQGGGK